MITLLFTVIIYGVVFYIAWWGLGQIALPDPFHKVAVVILVLAAVYVLIGILTGTIHPFPFLSSKY